MISNGSKAEYNFDDADLLDSEDEDWQQELDNVEVLREELTTITEE